MIILLTFNLLKDSQILILVMAKARLAQPSQTKPSQAQPSRSQAKSVNLAELAGFFNHRIGWSIHFRNFFFEKKIFSIRFLLVRYYDVKKCYLKKIMQKKSY